MTHLFFGGFLALGLSGCSDEVPAGEALLWAGPAIQALNNAISGGEGIGVIAQHRTAPPKFLPTLLQRFLHMFLPIPVAEAVSVPALSTCPALNSAIPTLATCIAGNPLAQSLNPNDPGPYLRRIFDHCSFGADSGVWYTNQITLFPDDTTCSSVLGSVGGLTPANIVAFNLEFATVTQSWGLGPNGNQDSFWLVDGGNVSTIYSDFASGFLEDKLGGTDITYGAGGNSMSVRIRGLHYTEYTWTGDIDDTTTRDRLQAILDANGSTADLLKVRWDATIHTPEVGDRMWNNKLPGSDTYYAASHPLEITHDVNGFRQVEPGGILQMQHNTIDRANQTLSRSEVTQRLRYTDPTCCHPRSGELTTTFSLAFPLPNDRSRAFDTDVITFDSALDCGQVRVTQKLNGEVVTGTPIVIAFPYCASGI